LDEAIAAAKYASDKTGVRTPFLLGVLRVESNLGQNVGGGRYKTDMNPAQHANFQNICKDLGLKATDMPVSRRVCYNTKSKDGCGGWGGAMGPAQFMPSTWMGYKDKVAKVTGNNPPNPWNIKDALVAMGLKLSSVAGVTSGKESAERQAAAMYLAGGAWQRYSWYGDRVMYYADGFEKYIKE
jgi:membrane-bound lytic murein transglycosylase B